MSEPDRIDVPGSNTPIRVYVPVNDFKQPVTNKLVEKIVLSNARDALTTVGINFLVAETVNKRLDQLSALTAVALGSGVKSIVQINLSGKQIYDNLQLINFATALTSSLLYYGIEKVQKDEVNLYDLIVFLSASLAGQLILS